MSLERMFEYTEKHLAAYFMTDGTPNFDLLIQHPCLFMDEGIRDEVAYVGRVTKHRISGKEIAIQYQIDREVPALRNDFIYEHRRHFDMTADWEFSRTTGRSRKSTFTKSVSTSCARQSVSVRRSSRSRSARP